MFDWVEWARELIEDVRQIVEWLERIWNKLP